MRFLRGFLALGIAAAACAQGDDIDYRWMVNSKRLVTEYLERRAREITNRAEEEISSSGSWEQARGRRLDEMRDMLGLLPWPRRTPLNVQIPGRLDQGDYIIEKIAFESMPKIYVTGNLYIPKQRPSRLPAIIYVCGHAPSPYGAKTQYQRHGISFAKNGYICFILDPIQIAETFGLHHGVRSVDMYDWYSRGYSPAGVEVWNAMRAIDYLETRPEVDSSRIGMTGRSGGAAMSWFTTAVDPRVKVVSPVMGISTYAANVHENTQRLHCDCMFPINTYLHDMIHQGALIAPRPLLMMHGHQDNLFPVAGYTEFEGKVGALYRSYGRSGRFGNVVVETAHKDSDFLRERAIRWFDRYFLQNDDRKLDMQYTNLPDETLAVFPQGPPAGAQNFRIQETFTTRPPSPPFTSLEAWKARREALLGQLRSQVFKALNLPPRNVEISLRDRAKGLPSRYDELELSSGDTVAVRALRRRSVKGLNRLPGLLYIASDGEDPVAINELLSEVNVRDASVRLVLYPRGVGVIPWDKTFWKGTLRNAMHTGQTVDSMRLADVQVAVEALRREPSLDSERIMLAGQGISGVLGLYAAILDPGIHQVMLINPPTTHVDGPIFLNVLRYTDLPEAAGLIAPRHLTFYSRMPTGYEYTRGVYKLYGKPERLARTMHLDMVVEDRYDHNFVGEP